MWVFQERIGKDEKKMRCQQYSSLLSGISYNQGKVTFSDISTQTMKNIQFLVKTLYLWALYSKRQLHTNAIQPQGIVVYSSRVHLYTIKRSISLQYLRIQPAKFSWRMSSAFDTQPNTVDCSCPKPYNKQGGVEPFFTAVHTSIKWFNSQRSCACASASGQFQISPYYMNKILGELWRGVLVLLLLQSALFSSKLFWTDLQHTTEGWGTMKILPTLLLASA